MSMDDIVRDIRAADDSTVIIRLHRPNAPFLSNLAMGFASISSPTAVREYREDYFKNPVGTGPFRFVEWVKDDRIVLERNEDYWRDPAYLDRVVIRSIPENTVRLLAIEKGEVQAMDGVAPLDARRIDKARGIYLMREAGMNVAYMAMNMEKPPFDKLEVRQAVNHAVNKKALIDGLYMGYGTPAVNPIPPTVWAYNEAISDFEYDPEKARALLAKAGVPEGTKITLHCMSNPRPYMPEPMKVAEVIQADLKKVGLDAELRTMEWGSYLDYCQSLKHQAAFIGWTGDNGDPDNFLYVLLDREATRIPAQNYSNYKSDELHDVLVEAQVTSDHEKRVELYLLAQEIIHRDVPWLTLAHMDQLFAFRNDVHGFIIHPTGKLRLRSVWVDPAS
jgi:peptide/nickel transport system substrate-binding protein